MTAFRRNDAGNAVSSLDRTGKHNITNGCVCYGIFLGDLLPVHLCLEENRPEGSSGIPCTFYPVTPVIAIILSIFMGDKNGWKGNTDRNRLDHNRLYSILPVS